mmetsp:Transcript_41066/g.98334  ORF Transcript_41066/g.98334 Transcript_41066/m.98334 type:complete len:323 (-) Transcript_41066:1724-2692(-)
MIYPTRAVRTVVRHQQRILLTVRPCSSPALVSQSPDTTADGRHLSQPSVPSKPPPNNIMRRLYSTSIVATVHRRSSVRLQSDSEQRRAFSRSSQSESDNDDPVVKAKNFLIRLNYSPDIADGVIDALKQSGMSGTSLLGMVRNLAGRWEVGEDNGLEDLVDSVKLQLARKQGRKPITLHVIPSNAWKSSEEDAPDFSNIQESNEEFDKAMSRAFIVEAQTGLTLTDVAKFGDGKGASELGEMIECACAGIMACSTCHVVVDPQFFDVVGEASDAEQDMLDLAYAPRSTSRLGCQIQLEENMDGMIIRLPRGANNLMDDIPFE